MILSSVHQLQNVESSWFELSYTLNTRLLPLNAFLLLEFDSENNCIFCRLKLSKQIVCGYGRNLFDASLCHADVLLTLT